MKKRNEVSTLSEKDQELIAVGASVAGGCLPCTKFHLRAASGVGAKEGEILQAVRDATRVRMAATEIMAKAGGLSLAEASQPIPDSVGIRSLIRELVSIGAAYAVNCATGLATHMAAARALGAADRQMYAAIKIACAIRDVASEKTKAAAGEFLGVSEETAAACDCTGDDEKSSEGATACAPDAQKGAGVGDCTRQFEDQRRSHE